MTPKLKKIILTVVVLIALFIIYAVFIKPDPVNEPLVSGRPAAGTVGQEDAQTLGNQISQALLRIEQIKLDKSIFNNDIYRSLQDRSQPITDEPIGRPNPFAPLGDMSNIRSSVRSDITASSSSATTTAPKTTTPSSNQIPVSGPSN